MDALKQELNQLFSSGLTSDQVGIRYREITAMQDQLLREDAGRNGRALSCVNAASGKWPFVHWKKPGCVL